MEEIPVIDLDKQEMGIFIKIGEDRYHIHRSKSYNRSPNEFTVRGISSFGTTLQIIPQATNTIYIKRG